MLMCKVVVPGGTPGPGCKLTFRPRASPEKWKSLRSTPPAPSNDDTPLDVSNFALCDCSTWKLSGSKKPPLSGLVRGRSHSQARLEGAYLNTLTTTHVPDGRNHNM